jgi:branched-chain amino acid transport system ATP-binding protein
VALVKNLISEIAKRGISVLLVEQKLTIALKIANRLYVMGHGKIVFEGTPQEFQDNPTVRQEWLEV